MAFYFIQSFMCAFTHEGSIKFLFCARLSYINMLTRATTAGRRESMKSVKKLWHRMFCLTQYMALNLQIKGPDKGSDQGNIKQTRPELKRALPDLHPKHYGSTTHIVLLLTGKLLTFYLQCLLDRHIYSELKRDKLYSGSGPNQFLSIHVLSFLQKQFRYHLLQKAFLDRHQLKVFSCCYEFLWHFAYTFLMPVSLSTLY